MSIPSPEILKLEVGPLQTNCYLVICPETRSTLLIDPGDEADKILDAARHSSARIEQILLTHTHPDHIGALRPVREATGARVLAHRLDAELLQKHGRFYGAQPDQIAHLLPDVRLEGGDQVSIGRLTGTVVHTPGHTPGSVTLNVADVLFTGDTLFAQGVGRTDLPGGNLEQLLDSIQRLFAFPDSYVIYPGHGPASTIGQEKLDNPYV